MTQYQVMYTINGKLGNKYEYVTADSEYEAKQKVKMMYKDSVTVHWAQKVKK